MVLTSLGFITPLTRTVPSDLISTRARSLARTVISNGKVPSEPTAPVEADAPDAASEPEGCGELSAASTVRTAAFAAAGEFASGCETLTVFEGDSVVAAPVCPNAGFSLEVEFVVLPGELGCSTVISCALGDC